jgi:hypothetical protein
MNTTGFRVVAGLLVILIAGAAALYWWQRPRLTETQLRETVVTTLQSEAEEAFLVTGVLKMTATSTAATTDYLLPHSFRLRMGSTEATVRMPGHVTYGFHLEALRPEMIHLTPEGVVEVQLPPLQPYSVDAQFDQIQIQTQSGGWQRWVSDEERQDAVRKRAMQSAYTALRRQAARHLETATQPRINTARALEQLLRPVLQAAGYDEPRFQFEIAPDVQVSPSAYEGRENFFGFQ